MKVIFKSYEIGNYWRWVIYYNNGNCAATGPSYKSKASAMRGFKRFLDGIYTHNSALWRQIEKPSRSWLRFHKEI